MTDTAFAVTPTPPYYTVIFSSQRHGEDPAYERTAGRMVELARAQPGFIGVEHARDAQGFGITVSYWETLASIAAWRAHSEHVVAQEAGRSQWYAHYELRVARVERAYSLHTSTLGSHP